MSDMCQGSNAGFCNIAVLHGRPGMKQATEMLLNLYCLSGAMGYDVCSHQEYCMRTCEPVYQAVLARTMMHVVHSIAGTTYSFAEHKAWGLATTYKATNIIPHT